MFGIPKHYCWNVHGERLHKWRGSVRAEKNPSSAIKVADWPVTKIKFNVWTPIIPPFCLLPAVVSLEETNKETRAEILIECLHKRELILNIF
tara:strand:+ start:88 stop:363 length:276 start_codon:yes stop_codon:yes gene_type:complete